MKWKWLILAILITSCTVQPPEPPVDLSVETLANAIESVEVLDDKYGGQWKLEHIPNFQADNSNMPDHIKDLETLIMKANESGNRDVYEFLSVRWLMLDTERLYLQAREFDPRELAEIVFLGNATSINASLDDFDCKNAAKIKRATELYAELLPKGQKVIIMLDDIMQRNIEARTLIGVKNPEAGTDTRPEYYHSRLGKVLNTIKINTLLLEQVCHVPVGKLYN